MKKVNLKGISKILSEKELKNVMGGSFGCEWVPPYARCKDPGMACLDWSGSPGTCQNQIPSYGMCACLP